MEPTQAAIEDASVIINIATRDVIIGYEENKSKSPTTNPTTPETDSISDASTGKNIPHRK